MFSELPKLIGRAFLIGQVLPGTLLTFGLWSAFAPGTIIDTIKLANGVSGTAAALVILWLVAIALSAINRPLIRLLQGYPFRPLTWAAKRAYAREAAPYFAEAARLEAARQTDPTAKPKLPDLNGGLQRAVTHYPDAPRFLLPTSLGNIMRAYEVYPRILYGLDSVPAWPRIVEVLPKETLSRLEESRGLLNFGANLVFASTVVVLATLLSRLMNPPHPIHSNLLSLAILSHPLGWAVARNAAHTWGDQCRAVFDLHRGDLAEALGLILPSDPAQERIMWRAFSRMTLYRLPSAADELARFRAPQTAEAQTYKTNEDHLP
ncbi:hypothetical protein [Rhodospirillum sp. A1_3_36]|uniref:hypothetical protein n=1 Tax=Rhodospirillum sp. A1_3_36 TaxID=3391666 RepID=UPI0039A5BC0D